MFDVLVVALVIFLPTLAVLAVGCDTNVARRPGQPRTGRPRTSSTMKSTADSPRTRSRTDRSAVLRLPKDRRTVATGPVSTRHGPATTTEGNDDKNSFDRYAEPGTDPAQTEAKRKNKPSSAATSSSERIEEVTCQDVGIDAEEMSTQQDTIKDTEKEMKTATGPGTGTGTGLGAGPWPSNMPAKPLMPSTHKSSVFDVVEKKDDVPSEFELDSVKRLQKMSREALTGGVAKSEVNVEPTKAAAVPPKSPAKSPKPVSLGKKKKEKKVDKKKEEEVRRWNEAIAKGNIFRPRKDDETVDEVQEEWGPPQR